MSTVNSINKSTSDVQGPTDDDKKNESRKAWTMEMMMNSGDISTNMTNEETSMMEPRKTIFISKFHQITGHTGEHLVQI